MIPYHDDADHREQQGDDSEDEEHVPPSDGVGEEAQRTAGGDRSDVPHGDDHAAQDREVLFGEPDGDQLHQRDVDHGHSGRDQHLPEDHHPELVAGEGDQRSDGSDHQERGACGTGTEAVGQQATRDLHGRVCPEVGAAQGADGPSDLLHDVRTDDADGQPVEVDEEIGDREREEDRPSVPPEAVHDILGVSGVCHGPDSVTDYLTKYAV